MNKIIIIGGGASGLFAALSASENPDNDVTILEKNSICGKKLNICGKGRGNITNTAKLNDFVDAFGNNGKFLYSAFSKFFNNDLLRTLEYMGLETITERGGRVFPITEKASDITDTLVNELTSRNVNIKYGIRAKSIKVEDNKVIGVEIFNGIMKCDKLIVATGGMSYPKTGSEGDGYNFAKECGHTITKLSPSICPIISNTPWIIDVAGLSLKNVEAKIVDKNTNKTLTKEFGEMLFTHTGVSGPIILTLSKYIADQTNINNLEIKIDLKPALSFEELNEKFTKEFKSNIILKNYFNSILPKSLAKIFSSIASIDENKKLNLITVKERKIIIDTLKDLTINIKRLAHIDEAIITKGGVSIKEIDPKTMESKIIKNLYFCGEVIDIDAKTGGYNLQAAFSTGYIAGQTN